MIPDTERVWADFHAGLRRFVSRRVRSQADADDVVQQVFLRVHRALPSLRESERIHAWIYQTTRRAIADYYRRPVERRELPSGDAIDLAAGSSATAPADADDARSAERELASCLQPLMAGLAESDREALRLVDVDGLTQAETARRLGISLSGMKSRVQRARARLRGVVEACCRVELDRRGRLVAFEPRARSGCDDCGPACED